MSKEIPAGASLSQISDILPDGFGNCDEAVYTIVEALQKGTFDTVQCILIDGESIVSMGYINIDRSKKELTEEDKTRISGMTQAGAQILARVPPSLALRALAHTYHKLGEEGLAMKLGMLAELESGGNPMQALMRALNGGEDGEDGECTDPDCDCHKHEDDEDKPWS